MSATILVLSEDGAENAGDTVKNLTVHILRLIAGPGWEAQQRISQVRLEPPASPAVRRTVRAQLWKSKNPRDYRDQTELSAYIADRLVARDSFVVFHIDGDCRWTERPGPALAQFDQFLQRRVLPIIQHRLGSASPRRGVAPATPPLVDVADRLLLMVPYYSIESWLYQHTREAIRMCEQHHRGAHVELFQEWRHDRALLDEVYQPKEAVCLSDQHNLELSGSGFPADEVWGAGTSFAETVGRFLSCAALCRALTLA